VELSGSVTREADVMTGEASYIELGVRDADAARAFYGGLLGWQASGDNGPGQVDFPMLSIGIHDGDDSSIFEVFFSIADLDASLAQVVQFGGRVTSEVNESPGFGRWAECADDQGVRFGLRQPE
jgi:predicted enzyme related to lactoylglutathione lyase